ncbi:hypothetical protein [Natrinema salsiterrestre]|uniref:Gluconate 2-dehydrogenase subunit 3 family protein n=1 Tax=Natrinema salsiterrestre TaxID=2950540 RepID=A0A9Q4L1J9_9EURY|nr:hypothetical protein [Natrinema salsiterrestre]MDF9748208.1 hypothetical protein [Natrinema salsiterrestre]
MTNDGCWRDPKHTMQENDREQVSRRGVVKGIGGLAALSMSNATFETAQAAMDGPLQSDPHTADTYRSIVDAIVPRTPELEDELGPEHVPGGLDAELEKFLIWDFNHFQEIRAEMVTENSLLDLSGDSGPEMPRAMFEVTVDTTGFSSDLDAMLDLADISILDLDLDGEAMEDYLTFGPVERFEIGFADFDDATEGPAEFELAVETTNESVHRILQNYPYAPTFTLVFDLVAAEFLALGKNEDPVSPNEQFPGGGTFTRLSREDRLRCLWTIVDGGAIDTIDDLLSPLVPDVGILKYVVMAVNGLHGFGYYTEWSGYGDTKTNTPNEREMQRDPAEVQSRQQSGYPGPAPGYAADWRHAVPGGFKDPKAKNLNLPDDLTGDDVIDGIGGDT